MTKENSKDLIFQLFKKIKEILGDTFVFNLFLVFFLGLKSITLIVLIRHLFRFVKDNDAFTDMWVLGNLIFSSLCLGFSWKSIVVYYGLYRVFGILIYQINVLLFGLYRKREKGNIHTVRYTVRSFRRMVLLLLLNYIEILFWFALFFRNWSFLFCSRYVSLDSFWGALYFSLVTMSTLGYGDISPKETWGLIFIIMQNSVGIFMALLILTRFISLLPRPETLDNLER